MAPHSSALRSALAGAAGMALLGGHLPMPSVTAGWCWTYTTQPTVAMYTKGEHCCEVTTTGFAQPSDHNAGEGYWCMAAGQCRDTTDVSDLDIFTALAPADRPHPCHYCVNETNYWMASSSTAQTEASDRPDAAADDPCTCDASSAACYVSAPATPAADAIFWWCDITTSDTLTVATVTSGFEAAASANTAMTADTIAWIVTDSSDATKHTAKVALKDMTSVGATYAALYTTWATTSAGAAANSCKMISGVYTTFEAQKTSDESSSPSPPADDAASSSGASTQQASVGLLAAAALATVVRA